MMSLISNLVDVDIWESVLSIDNIDDCVNCFNSILVGLLDLICPYKWYRIRASCPPWSRSPEVRNIQKLRDKAHHQALKRGSPTHWCEYRKLRNKAT